MTGTATTAPAPVVKSFLATFKASTPTKEFPFGTLEADLSVPELDRDGEIVDPGAFEPLPEFLSIDIDHALTVEKTVASGVPFYENGILKFKGGYASTPLAQLTRTLVDERHVRAVSVVFINPEREIDPDDGLVHVRKAELINATIAQVGINRSALIKASKALRSQAAAAAEAAALELGDALGVKSVVGSYEDRTDTVRAALRAGYPGEHTWVWVRATFDDNVVFDVETGGVAATFQAAYTIDDDGNVELGEPTKVDLAEVVIPAKALTRATISPSTPEPPAAAAPAAAATAPAVEVSTAKALAQAAVAEAALALLSLDGPATATPTPSAEEATP